MSLGEEEAAEVFKHLAPKEVQRLGETIARMKAVRATAWTACSEVRRTWRRNTCWWPTPTSTSRGAAQGAGRRQGQPADRPHPAGQRRHRHREPEVDGPQSVAELLRNEHPQIVAAILVHLEFDQAADVLKLFSERQRNEVMVRIATLDGIQPTGAEGPERGDEQGAGRRRPHARRAAWAA
jgi:flagellar motor switch protein FliG